MNSIQEGQHRLWIIRDEGVVPPGQENKLLEISLFIALKCTVKPVLSGQSKRRPKISLQDRLSLNAGQKYCRMLSWSILQYFRPSLSYHLSLRPLFCLFLSDCFRQVLLCVNVLCTNRFFLLVYYSMYGMDHSKY